MVCRSFHGEDNANGLVSTGRIDTAEGATSFDAGFFVRHVPDVSSRLLVRSRADHTEPPWPTPAGGRVQVLIALALSHVYVCLRERLEPLPAASAIRVTIVLSNSVYSPSGLM